MTRALSLLFVACVVAGLVWMLSSERGPRSPDTVTGPEVPAGAEALRNTDPRIEVAAGVTSRKELALPDTARIHGRVVDEAGAPLAGVLVELKGRAPNDEARVTWERAHGRIAWRDPRPITTAADGTFAFRIEPPEPFTFQVFYSAAGRVPSNSLLGRLAAADETDLGDVVVPIGVRFSGEVVDTAGEPVAGARLSFRQLDELPRTQLLHASTIVGDDGSFTMPTAVMPGRFEIEVQSTAGGGRSPIRDVVEPRGALEFAPGEHRVRVVVTAEAPDLRPCIRGVVVDEAGQPVAEALVGAGELGSFGPQGGNYAQARTDAAGRFELRHAITEPPAVATRVQAQCPGFRTTVTEAPVAWGTTGLALRLVSGPPLEIHVRSVLDGAPVTTFGVVLEPDLTSVGYWSSGDARARHHGEHEGGVLRLERVTPGRYRIDVRSPFGLTVSGARREELGEEGAQRLDFEIQPTVDRVVEVASGDGDPVVGVPVEVVEHSERDQLSTRMVVVTDRRPARAGRLVGSLEGRWTTDSSGRATIRYSPVEGVGLRLPGPGHEPRVVYPIPSVDGQVLRIVVATGAMLRGRIGPPEFLAWIHGADERGDGSRRVPVLRLERLDRNREVFPVDAGAHGGLELSTTGEFSFVGVPPGAWRLVLKWSERQPDAHGRLTTVRHPCITLAGQLDLRDGEVREVAPDVSDWIPVEVDVRTTLNGLPTALGGRLTLAASPGTDRRRPIDSMRVATHPAGNATLSLRPGLWTFEPELALEGPFSLPLDSKQLAVGRSGPWSFAFDFELGQARIRLLTPDGRPLPEHMPVWMFEIGSPPRRAKVRLTDTEDPAVSLLQGASGRVQIRARREPLLDPEALLAWRKSGSPGGELGDSVVVGEVELTAVPGPVLDLRLPEEWTRLPD